MRREEWIAASAYAVLAWIALGKGGQAYLAVAGYVVLVALRFLEEPDERLSNVGDFLLLSSLSFQDPRQLLWISGYVMNWVLAHGYGGPPIGLYHAVVGMTAPGGLESLARSALAVYWSLQ